MRPGFYEAKIGENISQLVDYAGGLKHTASSVISVRRVVPINKKKLLSEAIKFIN